MESNIRKKALELHKRNKGKIAIVSKVPLNSKRDLTLAYTPGVAEPCREIVKDKSKMYDYTSKGNTVAVITDGSAVLGLGNIGAEASLPVMEGKAILFKKFGNIDAIPICIKTQNTDEIVKIVKNISTSFGGINLEDISAPRCFDIESRLIEELDIPVMHDDQHGTAVVVYAALKNALKVVGKRIEDVKIVINGAGAAGIAIAKLVLCFKIDKKVCTRAREVILCDSKGAIYYGRKEGMNHYKEMLAAHTNREKIKGSLADAIKGADVFIGVSKGNIVTEDMIKSMNNNAIVFAMANPVPEIMPDKAKRAGAAVVATGRSDFPNQVNNSLAFPGIFRGTFDAKAGRITDVMKLAAADALSSYVKPTRNMILPDPLDSGVAKRIAEAVKKAAKRKE